MTTFTIHIGTDDQHLVKKFIDSIDSVKNKLHIPVEVIKKDDDFDIDFEIKNLKIIDEEGGKKLGEALSFLGQGLDKNFDYKEVRNQYLTKKNILWV